ncbi:hypothetical protein [Flavicella sp.]|uniref:hypothetical protein n=1 Tax=Flavicella sp. TaxID=2957742 RepID=UPI0030180668
MKKIIIFFSAILLLLVQNISAQVIQETQSSKERWNLVSNEGTVTAIDHNTREITLMGPKGNLNTLKASEEIKRFDEIKVDDKITFDYWTYIKAEFREPTLAERATPLQIVSEAGKAPEGIAPGVIVGAVFKSIVTIEVLNRPYMMATLKGSSGNYMSITVKDTKLLERVHIGQEIILTYSEAIAITLKKLDAK